MNFILFEDNYTHFLAPFSQMHTSFEVRCGLYTNLERLLEILEPTDTVTLVVRDELHELTAKRFSHIQVNPDMIEAGTWLNGATVWDKQNINRIKSGHSFGKDGILLGFNTEENIKLDETDELYKTMKSVTTQLSIKHISFLWDAINFSHNQIEEDFKGISLRKKCEVHPSSVLLNSENISIGKDSRISAGSILDASSGPIIIGSRVKIGIGSLIEGPAVISSDSTVNPGTKLRGNVVIGPVCKIGGEVEDSIFQGYSNKQHDGFLGHSYVGEWVNLGANTNTSDLKNTYGNINFPFKDESIKTGEIFIGSMIGDYVRTGISTMLNTGSNIGTGSCIFGSGFQNKYVPPFTWGKKDHQQYEPFILSAERMKNRRKLKLGDAEKVRLADIYKSK